MIISDYGNLAFSISNAFWNENVQTSLKDFTDIYEIFTERYSDIDEIVKKRCLGFVLGIPGNQTAKLYIVDTKSERYDRTHRRNGIKYQVIGVDMSIFYKSEVTIEELAEFATSFGNKIKQAFQSDPSLSYAESVAFTQFTTFAAIYYKYRLDKKMFAEVGKMTKYFLPEISDGTKNYENYVNIIYSRGCSEEKILRAAEDGNRNVQPNNIFKSRIVQ